METPKYVTLKRALELRDLGYPQLEAKMYYYGNGWNPDDTKHYSGTMVDGYYYKTDDGKFDDESFCIEGQKLLAAPTEEQADKWLAINPTPTVGE